jgi:hypothetical protein
LKTSFTSACTSRTPRRRRAADLSSELRTPSILPPCVRSAVVQRVKFGRIVAFRCECAVGQWRSHHLATRESGTIRQRANGRRASCAALSAHDIAHAEPEQRRIADVDNDRNARRARELNTCASRASSARTEGTSPNRVVSRARCRNSCPVARTAHSMHFVTSRRPAVESAKKTSSLRCMGSARPRKAGRSIRTAKGTRPLLPNNPRSTKAAA